MERAVDIPSPIDFTDPDQALRWVADTVSRRPYRSDFFRAFQEYLEKKTDGSIQILELGSGPGHLAGHLLSSQLRIIRYVLLDFSDAMHAIARGELETHRAKVDYVTADFRMSDALASLGTFDIVVTMQAVHELRHKQHAIGLYQQVTRSIKSGGHFLVCDHTVRDPSAKNAELFMNRVEQQSSLKVAGFHSVEKILDIEGMTLHSARRS